MSTYRTYQIDGHHLSAEEFAPRAADLLGVACRQRDEARAALAAVEAAIAPWPPGPRKGDVLRALEGER